MDVHIAEEILNELGSSLEALETQSAAILQFLKDKGIATDEQLAPYLEQAGNASNVRWRAARLRMERVLASAAKEAERIHEPVDIPQKGLTLPSFSQPCLALSSFILHSSFLSAL